MGWVDRSVATRGRRASASMPDIASEAAKRARRSTRRLAPRLGPSSSIHSGSAPCPWTTRTPRASQAVPTPIPLRSAAIRAGSRVRPASRLPSRIVSPTGTRRDSPGTGRPCRSGLGTCRPRRTSASIPRMIPPPARSDRATTRARIARVLAPRCQGRVAPSHCREPSQSKVSPAKTISTRGTGSYRPSARHPARTAARATSARNRPIIPAAGAGQTEPSPISQLAVTTIMVDGPCDDMEERVPQGLSIGPSIPRPTGGRG